MHASSRTGGNGAFSQSASAMWGIQRGVVCTCRQAGITRTACDEMEEEMRSGREWEERYCME